MMKILKSRAGIGVIAFVAGGAIAMLFFQETILHRRREETSLREKELQQQIQIERSQRLEAEKNLSKHQVVHKTKIIRPDGTVVEASTIETNTEILAKIRKEEQDRAVEMIRQKDQEWNRKFEELSIHRNPKRLDVFGGIGITKYSDQRSWSGGINYNLWGPFTVGVIVGSQGTFVPTLGVRF